MQTKPTTDIRFTVTKTGMRAYYWSRSRYLDSRWLPISRADAELSIATGRALDVTSDYNAGNHISCLLKA